MLRLLLGVTGLVGVIIAVPLLFAGGSLFWVDMALTDADGFINSPMLNIEVDGFALVIDPAKIESSPTIPDIPIAVSEMATLRIQATNLDANLGVFIGIASTGMLDAYLAGVSYAVVTGMDEGEMFLSYRMNAAGPSPAPPGEQEFWISSTAGVGNQQLYWELEEGDFSFVIMNEDASDGIAVEAIVGVRVPIIGPVGVGLLISGGLTLAIATILLAIAL